MAVRESMGAGKWVAIALVGVIALACAGGGGGAGAGTDRRAVRLADVFSTATVEGSTGDVAPMARTEWVWSGTGAQDTAGWKSLAGVTDLRVENGALRGRTAMPAPVLALDWTPPPEVADDKIHSIELRLRTSAGGRASFGPNFEEQVFVPALLGPNPFAMTFTSPIIPGDETKLYTLRPPTPTAVAGVKHLLLRPVDAAGAEFAIESVRVIFEREHLASIPAGLSWQGLDGTYRETLVARSPETLRFEVALPSDPYLELAVGTLSPAPVTFEITVGGESGGAPRQVRRTVTTPQRWEDVRVDLVDLAGKSTKIALRVEAADAGAIGLWGSPVVRSRVVAEGAPATPQGVVVVIIDTLRRDHLSVWGYDRETAPRLSALAAEGVVADDAISQAAWTKVSVPSILTSLYPTSHGVRDFADLLPASAETMAEVFRKAGYATFGFSAIPFTGKMTNLHQGYEQFREASFDLAAVVTSNLPTEKAARGYVDELLPWIEAHRDVPFFAVLHVEDPHSPYVAPQPFATEWAEPADPERYRQLVEQVRPKIDHPLMQVFGMPARVDLDEAGVDAELFVRYERDAYDALIHSTDVEIARVVERLDQLGLRDRVLLAFTSDHGTEFLDHGNHFHGHTVYGELNRVPMFFWGPSYVPAGVRIPTTVQNLDFMPTVLDLAGLEIPEAAQGQSLRPWFDAKGEESGAAAKGWKRAPAITEEGYVVARDPFGADSNSIVADGWKLIHNVSHPPPAAPPGGPPGGGPPGGAPFGGPPGRGPASPPPPPPEYELYDHAKDPLNLKNVAAENPDKVKELAEQLARWREMAQSQRLKSDVDLAAQASPEELERLRALGYL